MRFLLDTDTCIHALKTFNPRLILRLKENEGALATSTVVFHELCFGAEKYADPAHRMFLIDELMQRLNVLPFDKPAAKIAGQLRQKLKSMGHSIGPYDVFIAAAALAHNLTLVTGNSREFSRVEGLKHENWTV